MSTGSWIPIESFGKLAIAGEHPTWWIIPTCNYKPLTMRTEITEVKYLDSCLVSYIFITIMLIPLLGFSVVICKFKSAYYREISKRTLKMKNGNKGLWIWGSKFLKASEVGKKISFVQDFYTNNCLVFIHLIFNK